VEHCDYICLKHAAIGRSVGPVKSPTCGAPRVINIFRFRDSSLRHRSLPFISLSP
jgi:hypothetical protein